MGLFSGRSQNASAKVWASIDVLRQEIAADVHEGRGTLNRPKHAKAMARLRSMGGDASPALAEYLRQPRSPAFTPEGEVDPVASIEAGVAEDVATVLGDIGDGLAAVALWEQMPQPMSQPPLALAKFPLGVEMLIDGVRDAGDAVRAGSACGLGFVCGEHDRAASALAMALGDDSSWVRREAAVGAINLRHLNAPLHEALSRVSTGDPDEQIRSMAERALRGAG